MATITHDLVPVRRDERIVDGTPDRREVDTPGWFTDGTDGINERRRSGLPTLGDYERHHRAEAGGPWSTAGPIALLVGLVGAAAGATRGSYGSALAGAGVGLVLGGAGGYALGHHSAQAADERARAAFERDYPRPMFEYRPAGDRSAP